MFGLNKLKPADRFYNNGMLPPCFDHFFQNNFVSDNFTEYTRSRSKLYPLFCRLNITKQSLRYRGPLAWNKVPSSIKQIKSYQKISYRISKASYSNVIFNGNVENYQRTCFILFLLSF